MKWSSNWAEHATLKWVVICNSGLDESQLERFCDDRAPTETRNQKDQKTKLRKIVLYQQGKGKGRCKSLNKKNLCCVSLAHWAQWMIYPQRRRFFENTTEGGGGGGAFFLCRVWVEFFAIASRADFNLSSSALSLAASASRVALDFGAAFCSEFAGGLGRALMRCSGTMWFDALRFRSQAPFAIPRFSCAWEPKAKEWVDITSSKSNVL